MQILNLLNLHASDHEPRKDPLPMQILEKYKFRQLCARCSTGSVWLLRINNVLLIAVLCMYNFNMHKYGAITEIVCNFVGIYDWLDYNDYGLPLYFLQFKSRIACFQSRKFWRLKLFMCTICHNVIICIQKSACSWDCI